jgi:hypothetical protein
MLGPVLPLLERSSWPGSVGPTESSLSVSPSAASCLFVSPGTEAVVVAGFDRAFEEYLSWVESDCCAFWSVEGSYQPSASSPRFLHMLALKFLRRPRSPMSLPLSDKALPPSFYFHFI